jgi:hypothetical protein
VREKEAHLRLHIKPFFGRMRRDDIKREPMERAFLARMTRDKKLSAKRAKNVTATLSKVLVSAWEWEVLAALLRFPKAKTTETPFDFFTRGDSSW